MQRIPACIRTGMHSAAGFPVGSVGQIFAGRKSTSENHMKKSSGVATSILKTVRNAARRQSVRTSSRLHFLGSGTGYPDSHAVGAESNPGQPGAGTGDAGDRTEYPGTKMTGIQAG